MLRLPGVCRERADQEGVVREYVRRIIDDELDVLLAGLPAISIEGPKAVGKTATALQRARTVHRLDDPAQAEVLSAAPDRVTAGPSPVLLDEWQRLPRTWDDVRRAVDEDDAPGRFILTGSATVGHPALHSGAGRIISLRLRPLALAERLPGRATVSLGALLQGARLPVGGRSELTLADYTDEILASGFPAIRRLAPVARRVALDGYLARITEADVQDAGQRIRNPATLRRWMTAYAAATSTTASLNTIREAAAGRREPAPAKTTALPYHDVLRRLWIVDPVPAWLPGRNALARLTAADKHQLADPALAARLLGVDGDALLSGRTGASPIPRDGSLLGALFESLVTTSVRTYAQHAQATVAHFRTKGGEREVDLIVEREDRRVLAVEVKLSATVDDGDVRHLRWLGDQLGSDLVDSVVITTGREAYRRPDGIAVVPAELLGP